MIRTIALFLSLQAVAPAIPRAPAAPGRQKSTPAGASQPSRSKHAHVHCDAQKDLCQLYEDACKELKDANACGKKDKCWSMFAKCVTDCDKAEAADAQCYRDHLKNPKDYAKECKAKIDAAQFCRMRT